ncbi:MAG: cysteine desulfurase family protein [Bdellovibrionales bacterium]|nr:cysteine desulfurase family protein [Bdellovibrionales bacterium]
MEEPSKTRRIYLDYNATTPPHPVALKAAKKALELWGNPSSVHQTSTGAKALLWETRQFLARFIGCHPLEIIFTSGASEANNQALKGLFSMAGKKRRELIVSAIEHPSIKAVAKWLSERGFKVHTVPVSKSGFLDESFFEEVLSENTLLVSIMRAHNETGVFFPIEKLIKKAHTKGAIFHSDMVQSLGKEKFSVKEWGVDLASFSAHKVYGLKGCGALYCRKGVVLDNLIHGGGQERGRRAGTENLVSIASFGAVLEKGEELVEKSRELESLRDYLEKKVHSSLSGIKVVGEAAFRLPNTSCLCISGVEGESLLMNLDLKGFSVSVGSACSSGKITESSSLRAMGLTTEEARSSIRVSLGLGIEKKDIDLFVENLQAIVTRLRSL